MLRKYLKKCSSARSNASLWIFITLLVGGWSFLVFYLVHSVNGEVSPVVRLYNGNLIGFTQDILGKPIYTYLNVPYALPADKYRFRIAQPADAKWPQDRIAKTFGPSCPVADPQIDYAGSRRDASGIEYSEDCLQLNIWTPLLFNQTNPKDDKKLKPVLVFIHGGALLFGSAVDQKSFDGSFLASMGDLIVVTINYRLGILGFLFNGHSIGGNLGLWDQRLALFWLRENIDQFGGDPNKITLAGESAGSWSVGIHLMLEEEGERPFFHRAIMMSGSPLPPVLEEPEETALKKFELVSRRTGCTGKWYTQLECLRKVPLSVLMELNSEQEIIKLNRNTYRLAFQPVYGPDNLLLDKSTIEQLMDRQHRIRNMSLLIGNLVNEGQDAWTIWKASFQKVPVKEPAGSMEAYIEALEHFVNSTVQLNEKELRDLVANLRKFYFKQEMPVDALEDSLRSSFYQTLSDLVFICPSKFYAKSYFRKAQSVYEYQITYASLSAGTKDFDPTCEEDKFGPCHTLDLQYLFGRPFKLAVDYSESDRTLSRDLIKFVSHFAYTGEANWRPYFKLKVRGAHEMIVSTHLELNPTTKNKEHTGEESLACGMLEKYFYNRPFDYSGFSLRRQSKP